MDKNLIIGINAVDKGSTGNIMRNALEYSYKTGLFNYLVIVPYNIGKKNTFGYLDNISFFGKAFRKLFRFLIRKPDGFKEFFATKTIIKKIKIESKKYNKTLIHLHNIHKCDISFLKLFRFLKRKRFKIIYTFHDGWMYTGGCYCYNYIKCFKWQTGCNGNCPQKIGSLFYSPNKILRKKIRAFKLIKNNITIIAVSKWLKSQIELSFLKDYKILQIYGECNITKPKKPDFLLKKMLHLENKIIVLSVAAYWNEWKGVEYIYKIANKLPKNYILLIVGGEFDTNQHKNIIHIKEIDNDKLNSFYSIADVYISTSQDESLGLTTCEAQICGIPVIGFGHGGVKETITNKTGYIIGKDNNVYVFVKKIIQICENKPFVKKDIIFNGNKFLKYNQSKKIFKLYRDLVK